MGGMAAPLSIDAEADMLALVLGETVPAPPTPMTIAGETLLSGREMAPPAPDEQDEALEALRRRAAAGRSSASEASGSKAAGGSPAAPEREPMTEIAEHE